MKPSNFTKHPYDSVFQHTETEVVARNIMVILARTGNVFRLLTWDEYVSERLKDTGFSVLEHTDFDRAVGYCVSEDTAKLFSSEWAKVQS